MVGGWGWGGGLLLAEHSVSSCFPHFLTNAADTPPTEKNYEYVMLHLSHSTNSETNKCL